MPGEGHPGGSAEHHGPGTLGDRGQSGDHCKSPFGQNIFHFQQRIVVIPVAVHRDHHGRGPVAPQIQMCIRDRLPTYMRFPAFISQSVRICATVLDVEFTGFVIIIVAPFNNSGRM